MSYDTITYPTLYSGLRSLSTDETVYSGMPYNCAIHSSLSYNQDLIETTFRTKTLVNDAYPIASGSAGAPANTFTTYSGNMIAQWGPFIHKPGVTISGMAHLAPYEDTETYPSGMHTDWWFASHPQMQEPTNYAQGSFEKWFVTISGSNHCSYPIETHYGDSVLYNNYPVEFDPDPGNGIWYYVSLLGRGFDTALGVGYVCVNTISLWEVPFKSEEERE